MKDWQNINRALWEIGQLLLWCCAMLVLVGWILKLPPWQ